MVEDDLQTHEKAAVDSEVKASTPMPPKAAVLKKKSAAAAAVPQEEV